MKKFFYSPFLLFCLCPLAGTSLSLDYPRYLRGGIVPLVTPYKGKNAEEIDLEALRKLVDYLCSTRASALFPVSGTGQWPLLTMAEKKEIILTCVKASRKRKPVLAGVGSPNSLEEEIELAIYAQKNGADGVVLVTPDFIRVKEPIIDGQQKIRDQHLLADYYITMAAAVQIPILIYDPESELEPSTLAILVQRCPQIKGIKLREKIKMDKFHEMAVAVQGKAAILSGSEIYACAAMKEGAVGFIGNGLNLYPNLGDDLAQAAFSKDWKKAENLQGKISQANANMEKLGGGAQGIKKILNDVIGIPMNTANRGDQFRAPSYPGEYEEILTYFKKMNLPTYKSSGH